MASRDARLCPATVRRIALNVPIRSGLSWDRDALVCRFGWFQYDVTAFLVNPSRIPSGPYRSSRLAFQESDDKDRCSRRLSTMSERPLKVCAVDPDLRLK